MTEGHTSAVTLGTRRTGKARRRLAAFAVLALVAGLVAILGTNESSASPQTTFEITDANIVDDAAPAPDWDTIYGPGGQLQSSPSGTLGTGFVADLISSDNLPSPPCNAGTKGDLTVFTSSGSDKNGDAFSTMTFESGSVPKKDDLSNVYAYARIDPDTNHMILYVGLERIEASGASHVDFEFLQSNISLVPTHTDSRGCPAGAWSGDRTVGDLLISMDFSNGGTIGTQEIRRWNGTEYVVVTLPSTSAGIFQNNTTIACGDWTCRDDTGAASMTLTAQAFTEGFVDTADPNLNFTGCFSSYTVHTRSSPSFTSELKDFALGGFNTCDANIQIRNDGVNTVGEPHTVTGHVNVRTRATFDNAPAGTTINFVKVSGPGTLSASSCQTVGTTGECSVTLNSTATGVTVVKATTDVTVGNHTMHRETDGTGTNSGPLTKRWVDAAISITPDGVNEVNNAHEFTVVVTAIPSGASPVTISSPTVSVTPAPDTQTALACDAQTGNTRTCRFSINENESKTFTANATATITMGTESVTRSTSGTAGPGGSGPATKKFVDARVRITPNDVNAVGDPHTFDIEVTAFPGTATPVGFGAIQPSVSPAPTSQSNTCATPSGTGNTRTCTLTINSNSGGVFTANVQAAVTMGGRTVTRSTAPGANSGPGGSGPATKTYVDASVSITPDDVNEVGQPHPFTITVKAHPNGATPVSFGTVTARVSPTPSSQSPVTCGSPANNIMTCSFTINSSSVGTFTANADAAVTMGGVTVNRSTDGTRGPEGSGPAVKKYVDSRIRITPSGVNAAGHEHVFTIEVTALPGTAGPVSFGTIAPSVSPTPDSQSNTCATPTVVSANVRTCTLTINHNSVGLFTANAQASVTVANVTMSRSTAPGANSGPGGSGPATKRYVNAAIAVSPDGVNEVGDPHVFTVEVMASQSADSVSFGPISVSVSPAPASQSSTCSNPTVSADGHSATCTVTINSPAVGTFVVHASGSVTMDGATTNVSTSDPATSQGPATKHYVDAAVSITPNGVNEVGDPHTFTINVTGMPGNAGAATFDSIQVSVSPAPASQSDTCSTPTVSRNTATCTLTINSPTTGVFTANASASVTMGGVTVSRSTSGNAGPGGSGPATKRYVDARIDLTPATAVNGINEPHSITAQVTQNDGSGSGPAPDGTVVTFSLPENAANASFVNGNTCSTVGGSCSVQINSSSAGRVVIHATTTFGIQGASVTRSTNTPGNGADVEKIYVAGSLRWSKVDDGGQPLGGAGFRMCQTDAYDSDSGTFVDIADACVVVQDDGGLDLDPTPSQFLAGNLPLGRYTVQEVSAPVGYTLDPAVRTVELTTAAPDGTIADPFVDGLVPMIEVLPLQQTRPQPPPPPAEGPALAILPVTGAPISHMVRMAVILIGLGLGLIVLGSRRRKGLAGIE